MRLAYFSPLPPQKSGISDYSEVLLPHLSNYYDIDLWVNETKIEESLSKNYQIIKYNSKTSYPEKLAEYDVILYNLGNNPYYHTEMYEIFLKYPGIVILHDYVLYYLITGYYLSRRNNCKEYLKEFYYNYGDVGIRFAKLVLRGPDSPLEYKHPERYPLVKRVIENAKGIIVHSESTKNLLINQNSQNKKIVKINQVNYSNMNFSHSPQEIRDTRKKFNINDEDILVSSFGYISYTKRNLQIIEVINEILSSVSYPIKYLMVGEGSYVDGLLNDNIIKTGYVPREEFETLICCSDIVVNLRYPSMGETSATLLQAMTAEKPCIVSNSSWFSELPSDTVIKITTNESKEKKELKDALWSLISDDSKKRELSQKAREYVLKYHDPSKIGMDLNEFINSCLFSESENFSKLYLDLNSQRLEEIGLQHFDDKFSKHYREVNYERLRSDLGFNCSQEQSLNDNIQKYHGSRNFIKRLFKMK
jgi:glycosyltransferase involved in cell wall biosynthesis